MYAILEQQKDKAKGLWISYLKETSIKKATKILRKRSQTIDEVMRIQQVLFLNEQFECRNLK